MHIDIIREHLFTMEDNYSQTFHGEITPLDFAKSLIAEFNQENIVAQQIGNDGNIVVQIRTKDNPSSGGRTTLSVILRKVEDGVLVNLGKQSWLGVVASIGKTAAYTWRNPWSIINRLDDIAQDIEYINLSDQIWKCIENTAQSTGASFELSERLRRIECDYCHSANPVGESNCISCGAPMGNKQPATCPECGFVLQPGATQCENCGARFKD